MSRGTYEEFRDALRAFESGWDRDRYEAGIIIDAQLDAWAGGPVTAFFPGYTTWGDLTDAEWDAMSYRSMNDLGFVGYQFGEALLIDLGYYEDDVYYLGGDTINRWDGTWTGKNGVTSLEEFMTAEAQEVAIQEAFGFNLQIIEGQLSQQGRSLDEFLGQTFTYTDVDGSTVSVEMTLTGLMAAAHLRGAFGAAQLLLGGTASTDENGTSILRYVADYGGYDSPSVAEAIAFFEDRRTGDEGGAGSTALGEAGVTAETADVVLSWDYGAEAVVTEFDPATGTIFVDWIGAGDLEVSQAPEGVVFAIPGNLQSLTLAGVTLQGLSATNFTFLDASAAAEVLALVGPGDDGETGDTGDTGETGDTGDTGDTGTADLGNGTANVTKDTADVVLTWSWGADEVVMGFDPAINTIFVDWIPASHLGVQDTADGVRFTVLDNNQALLLVGIQLAELSSANFTILDDGTAADILALVGDGDGMGNGHGDVMGDGGHGDGTHTDGDHNEGGHGDGGHIHQHITIDLATPAQVIDGFMPAMGDMIEIAGDVTADAFNIFEESGDALGQTVRIEITDGGVTRQIVFTGFGLDDLNPANITAVNQGVQNEIAAALGSVIVTPGAGEGYTLSYDTDGSNPAATTGVTEAGGVKYRADSNADDILGFDPTRDEIDVGGISVHGMIVTKSPTGEIVIDSPWSDAAQIVQGVTYQDVTIDSFGVVGNEHFRQDIGGVVSWEQGVGPRAADTVYVRSHEYGVHEVVEGFDPTAMKISFLYFGTRERLSVEDSAEGLVISSLPSGQSVTFTGVTKAELIPGLVEFHFDQVMEDNLEDAFGFAQEDVTLVDRTVLLTPAAPAGASTDGFQTRTGDLSGSIFEGNDGGDGEAPGGGSGGTGTPGAGDTVALMDGVAETYTLAWSFGTTTTVTGFNPAEDVFDFGSLGTDQVGVSEAEGDLVFEVLGNGGDFVVLEAVQAEDLGAAALTAPGWSAILDDDSPVMQALVALGYDAIA